MMKYIVAVLAAFVMSGCTQQSPVDEEHFYAKSGTACAHIFYDVPNAPPLQIDEREIVYTFDDDNLLQTSSPITFSWASEESSGGRMQNVYIDGEKIARELPIMTSAYEKEGEPTRHFTVIHFNDVDECFDEDSFKNNALFEELLQRVYK